MVCVFQRQRDFLQMMIDAHVDDVSPIKNGHVTAHIMKGPDGLWNKNG